jgi:hypothetical protein
MRCIIQLSFVSTTGEKDLLPEELADFRSERARDSNLLIRAGGSDRSFEKTVIRFYEHRGTILRKTERMNRLKKQHVALSSEGYVPGLWGWSRTIQYRWIDRRVHELTQEIRSLVLNRLRSALRERREVAIETVTGLFRLARPNEIHELFESASRTLELSILALESRGLLYDLDIPTYLVVS